MCQTGRQTLNTTAEPLMSQTTSPEALQTEAEQFRTEFQSIRDAVGLDVFGRSAVVLDEHRQRLLPGAPSGKARPDHCVG